MRNLALGPKFPVLVAAAVVITLAVRPIGYAEAEKMSADNHKEKRNAEEGGVSPKHQRSADFAEKPPFYQKWETGTEIGDDDAYSARSDASGSSSYEDDGYGYDDDDYDHFNYKRYDSDKSNEENKDALASDKRGNVVVPEVTTIELLSFQAKNMNPMAENVQQPKDDSKMKPFSMKKPPYSEKHEEKEDALVEEKLKKKTSDEQKPDGNASDKNTGNVKVAENKASEGKDFAEGKGEKGKVSGTGTTGSTSVQNPKESPQLTGDKENSVSVSDGKNEAKMTEKDLKNAEAKFQQEEKNSLKMKAEKDSDTRNDEAKVEAEAATDESKEKSRSQLEGNPVRNDFKDEFDNVNDPVVANDEKDSEDNGMNLAGLRDSRNELPYRYPNGFRFGKVTKKKEAGRRVAVADARSGTRTSNWASKAVERESRRGFGAKEPFRLEFPVSDLENTDFRRNHLKSLQRFKNLEESAGILGQGDTPSPYADETKKYLAPKVIEEEQRKRRSRLRRLKADPAFSSIRKRGREEEEEEDDDDDAYDYGSPPRARIRYGTYGRNVLGEGYGQLSGATKNYRRRGSHQLRDTYSGADEFEDEGTRNIKNKRQDDAGFYVEEDETYAEKRKSQGKSGWGGGENQKKKLKETNLYEDPGRYNTPLVLLQRNDNGQQAMKTFVDGRYKNEEGVDSEDLARLLSRDSNYVVLRKVPAREEALGDYGDSKRDNKFQMTHLDLTMKAQHPSNLKEPDVGKLSGTLKEGHGDHSLKGKENRIEDLSDFFKGDGHDERDFDEKKEMLMSIDNRLGQYQRGEPDKSVIMYKPSLSQAYRHMKDLDETENLSDSGTNAIRIADKSAEKEEGVSGQAPERLLKSFKKDGKEFLVVNRSFGGMSVKGKGQDAMMRNVDPLGMASAVPGAMAAANAAPVSNIADNGNIAQATKVLANGMRMVDGGAVPPSMYQNAMPPGNNFQEIKLPEVQSGMDGNRKYFLYGSENTMTNSPKHEIKVMQGGGGGGGGGGFGLPPDSTYNSQNYNQQYFNSLNYNKASPMKNAHGGKAQSLKESTVDEYAVMQQPYGYGKTQQCAANGYRRMSQPAAAEGFKKLAKKDKSSGDLERFMRDFRDFSQASYPSTYKSTNLPGTTLQELTGHGDRHLQKLNNLLKEIMSNKAEENADNRGVKNLKRGMFQKYKDQKSWPTAGRGGEAQVRSGKWTSVIYDDGSSRMAYSDEGNSPGESSVKDRKFDGKDATAMLSKDSLSSKRIKRQSGYDFKDSTKILEQKVKSTPYVVQPQPLFPNANANERNANTNQQHKSPTKACLQLPPDKLLDLLNFLRSERDGVDTEKNGNECLCRRSAPAGGKPSRRKLLSLSEKESSHEIEQKKAECVRKSFDGYLEPLVRKIGEYETKAGDRSRRSCGRGKREIELDESMPNDFQNFLVTSVGSFGSQKRGVVKKDEAVWDSEGSRDESTLGKRDTSGSTKTEKKSVSKDDATNIRIKIVDGNGNEELEGRASEGGAESKEAADSNADPRVHEVYLITNADSKRRKKKKFASIGSDQSPQKQPISNHLPQVETVYNPSPGSNKAQMEKISGDAQLKGKCAQSSTAYNATASMMEDNIIRNNLRTGNINTFTYQHKEEPTPYPLQGPTNPPSSEFEMLNSKSLSRTKPFSNRVYDYGDRYAPAAVGNGNSEIIYKDQNPQQYNGNGGVSMSRPGYRSNPTVRVFKSGAEGSAADRYRKDYAEEESAYPEYEDGESFSDEISERQTDQDYEEQDSGRQGNRRQDAEEYSRARENLDPKMVALWNDYAGIHLSPEKHKEAMEREFEEAYFRSSGQARYVGGNLNQPNLGVNLIQNLNPTDLDRLDKQKTREKLSKRLTKPSEPVQIGRRFFYTFKSEVPDEEYYSLYQGSSHLKGSSDTARTGLTENVEKSGVTKLSNPQLERAKTGAKRNADDFRGNRVKRSEGRTKAAGRSKIDKRLSSGRATENRSQKYHRKNLNPKREEEEGRRGGERGKRDSLADFLKADMQRRIEEEKKIRSKVKGLSSDLTKYDIPLIGGSSPGEEVPLPDVLVQRLEEEKKKERNMDRNPFLEDRQQQQQQQPFHFGNLKSGNPDVFKTFEIKRGRREDGGSRAEEGRHAIVGRAGSSTYQDRVFLKGVKTRKVKKYSNEGFEPLTPDARFSEKSSLYSEASKASEEKERSSSSINRRAGEKRSKLKDAGAGGQQKLQKLTHGFSHEAPLLTAASPLSSPKIFDALKDGPPPKEVLSLRKHPAEASFLASADPRDRTHLKSSKASAAAKEPLVSAVLVLTKRENPSERRVEEEHAAQSPFRRAERSKASCEEEEERPSGEKEKRRAEWLKDASGELSRFRPAGQSPEIVNEGADCRSTEGETPAKTVNNKMVPNVKQSRFPFRPLNNDRNEGGTGIGNSGEDILESILARVESNPHFRKVIGPGLKWRGRKCNTEPESTSELSHQPQNRDLFVRQVRKILARFVRDIEALASQDFSKNVCSKLDSNSKKFLHELLDVPYETAGTCKRRKYLGSLLGESSASGSRSNIAYEDSSLNAASAEAKENRRDLVARLLGEYRSLPDEEKRSVEVLGQYLNHELNTLNKALITGWASPGRSGKKHEGRTTPAASSENGGTNTEEAGIASDASRELEKEPKQPSARAPHARSNPKNLKSVKDNCGTDYCPPSSVPMTRVPTPKDLASISTESSNAGGLDESAETNTSFRTEDKKPEEKGRMVGGVDKPGCGDATGLRQSLRSRAPWLRNLNPSKGKSVDESRMAKQQPVTDFPPPDDYAEAPPANEERSDDTYGLDYQEYNVYDVYQAQDVGASKHRERTPSGGSRAASP